MAEDQRFLGGEAQVIAVGGAAVAEQRATAQQEIRALCNEMWPLLMSWTPQFADWCVKRGQSTARQTP
jgi:hypothetical protein